MHPGLNHFSDYISEMQTRIQHRRKDCAIESADTQSIIQANSPFEFAPPTPTDTAALLIHGFLDSPFTMRELGAYLAQRKILTHAILLPGHGTNAHDLCSISYRDWLASTQYGITSFDPTIKNIYLIGYSMGAILALYQALDQQALDQPAKIRGVIMITPAIQTKFAIRLLARYHDCSKRYINHQWLRQTIENDYARYQSINLAAVAQVVALSTKLRNRIQHTPPNLPLFLILSLEDETICTPSALQFFSRYANQHSQLLLYHAKPYPTPAHDPRWSLRQAYYPHLHINHLSHRAVLYSPSNAYYGQTGSYLFASRLPHLTKKPASVIYGAYNEAQMAASQLLQHLHLVTYRYQRSTYNPDFDYLAARIGDFIEAHKSNAKAT